MNKNWHRVLNALALASMCAPLVFIAMLTFTVILSGTQAGLGFPLVFIIYAWFPGSIIAVVIGAITLPFFFALRSHRPVQSWHAGLAGATTSSLFCASLTSDAGVIALFGATGFVSGLIFYAALGPDERQQTQL